MRTLNALLASLIPTLGALRMVTSICPNLESSTLSQKYWLHASLCYHLGFPQVENCFSLSQLKYSLVYVLYSALYLVKLTWVSLNNIYLLDSLTFCYTIAKISHVLRWSLSLNDCHPLIAKYNQHNLPVQTEITNWRDVNLYQEHSDDISKLPATLPYFGPPEIKKELRNLENETKKKGKRNIYRRNKWLNY